MKFVIRHLSGSKSGKEEVFETKLLTVGRDPSCTVVFDPNVDDRVSATHAQIVVLDNGTIQLSDLGSSNGTYLGEQQISGPTAISTGALVTFGDGGPQVSINVEAPTPPPPPAAPPPPKKSKKKLIIGVALGVLLVVGILALALGGSAEERPEETPAEAPADAPPADAPPADAPPTEEPPTEEPPTEEPPQAKGVKSPWADLGLGTAFTFKSQSLMEVGGNKIETSVTMKHTLTGKAGNDASIELETIIKEGTPGTKSEYKVPLESKVTAGGETPKYDEEKLVDLETPAGTFKCTYRKWTTGTGDTMETWSDDSLPLPYKSVSTTKTSTTTDELVALDKK